MFQNFHLQNKRPFSSLTRCEPIMNVIKVTLSDNMGLQLAKSKGTWILECTTCLF